MPNDGSITDGYTIRRKAVDFSVCLLTNIKLSILIIEAINVSTGSVSVALNLTYLNAFIIDRIALIAEVRS